MALHADWGRLHVKAGNRAGGELRTGAIDHPTPASSQPARVRGGSLTGTPGLYTKARRIVRGFAARTLPQRSDGERHAGPRRFRGSSELRVCTRTLRDLWRGWRWNRWARAELRRTVWKGPHR